MATIPADKPRLEGAELLTQLLFSFVSPRKAWAAVAALFIVFGSPLALAQDDEPIEWSVIAPLATKSLLLDATRADGALVVVGERGHILVSTDAGKSWEQAKVPTRSTLTGVYFHGRNLGWVVGHDSVILRTTDGGTTWERVHWAPEDETPLLDVWFADAESGLAIGSYGSCLITTDGGETWSPEPIGEDDFHLNQLTMSSDGRLYVAAEAGIAYRSDDDGSTWIELTTPYVGSFFGVLPLDGDTVLLFGLRGHLYRSEDAGETWTQIETGTVAMLNAGIRLDDGTIVIVGLGGVVLVSKDGGLTFELHQQSSRAGIQTVVDVGGGSLLLVGEFGVRLLPLNELSSGKGE